MSQEAKRLTHSDNLCIAGGVALNCVANRNIINKNIFRNVWIQPAAGDSGGSLGAAFAAYYEYFKRPREVVLPDAMKGCLLGPAYDDEEIEDFLEIYGFPYEELCAETIAKKIAVMVSEGSVIALYQGRMEFGPRALGARSIIADPRTAQMQSILNKSIKFRESFRPFAPAVLENEARKWFDLPFSSPYMLFVAPVAKDKRYPPTSIERDIDDQVMEDRSRIAAVTHVDYTARVQTLSENSPIMLKKIVEEFYELTDVPLLINTSFNLRGEPIVCTPADAYRCMMRSGIDALLMGKFLIRRDQQPPWKEVKPLAFMD